MTAKFAVTSDNVSTGAAATTFDITTSDLGGDTPDAVFFIITRLEGVLTSAAHAIVGYGAATGASQEGAVAFRSEDNQANTNTKRYFATDRCILMVKTEHSGLDGSFSFNSFIPNGCRLTVEDQASDDWRVIACFWSGVEAELINFIPPTATDTTFDLIPSPTFEPTGVLFFTPGRYISSPEANDIIFGIGAAGKISNTQGSFAQSEDDNQTDGVPNFRHANDRALVSIYGNAATVDWAIEITNWASDRITAYTRDGGNGDSEDAFALVFGGLDVHVSLPTDFGKDNTDKITDISGVPMGVIAFLSKLADTATTSTGPEAGAFAVGAASETDEYAVNHYMEDAALTTNTGTEIEEKLVYLTDDDGTVALDATLNEFTNIDWTPAYSNNVNIWYDADDASTITESGGAVSQWDDKSGNGNHIVQATSSYQPTTNSRTLNSLNVIDFDGVNDRMKLTPYSIPDAFTIIMVAIVDTATVNANDSLWSVPGAVTPSVDYHAVDAGVLGEYRFRALGLGVGIDTGVDQTGAWHLFEVTYDDPGNFVEVFIDGGSKASSSSATGTIDSGGLILMQEWTEILALDAAVAEFIILDTDDTVERQKTEGYLAHKWGLTSGLPAVHPYKNTKPKLDVSWSPAASLNVLLWYDADDASTITESGGAVSQMDDKSGNDYHLAQGTGSKQPTTGSRTQNGLNVIDFDGTDDTLEKIFTLTADHSVFMVGIIDTAANDYDGIWSLDNTAGSTGDYQFDSNDAASNNFLFRYYHGLDGSFPDTGTDQSGAFHIFEFTFDDTSGDYEAYIDGTSEMSGNHTQSMATSQKLKILSNRGENALADGAMAEFIIYDRVDDDERQKTEGYLAHKWGLTSNLPASHPYKYAPPGTGEILFNWNDDDTDDRRVLFMSFINPERPNALSGGLSLSGTHTAKPKPVHSGGLSLSGTYSGQIVIQDSHSGGLSLSGAHSWRQITIPGMFDISGNLSFEGDVTVSGQLDITSSLSLAKVQPLTESSAHLDFETTVTLMAKGALQIDGRLDLRNSLTIIGRGHIAIASFLPIVGAWGEAGKAELSASGQLPLVIDVSSSGKIGLDGLAQLSIESDITPTIKAPSQIATVIIFDGQAALGNIYQVVITGELDIQSQLGITPKSTEMVVDGEMPVAAQMTIASNRALDAIAQLPLITQLILEARTGLVGLSGAGQLPLNSQITLNSKIAAILLAQLDPFITTIGPAKQGLIASGLADLLTSVNGQSKVVISPPSHLDIEAALSQIPVGVFDSSGYLDVLNTATLGQIHAGIQPEIEFTVSSRKAGCLSIASRLIDFSVSQRAIVFSWSGGLDMDTFDQDTSGQVVIDLSFLNVAAAPTELHYTIHDVQSGNVIRGPVEIVSPAAQETISILSTDNVIVDEDNDEEERILTIKAVYTDTTDEAYGECRWRVRNLLAVGTGLPLTDA